MWEEARGCYLAGTTDTENRNQANNQLPLDTQSWSALAIPNILSSRPQLLDCAEKHHRTTEIEQSSSMEFSGFDFNDDRDGIWLEGTAQMTLAYDQLGQIGTANALLEELTNAQSLSPNGEGVFAALRDGVSTGFSTPTGDPFKLFRRLHIAATGWKVMAHVQFNPFNPQIVNNAPMADPQSVTAVENVELEIMLTGDDGNPELTQTLSFILTSLPSTGNLSETSNGPAITSVPLTLSDKTVYFKSAFNDTTQQTFQFQVMDDGGTANGGVDTSTQENVTINFDNGQDGLTDSWEQVNFGHSRYNSDDDPDADGLTMEKNFKRVAIRLDTTWNYGKGGI